MHALQGRHPRHMPHWYLWCMGVHPSFRRRGVASALARFVIAQADAAGVGCYTETFGDKTEALYRGFGFEVRERWEVLPGAPMARTMWRDPRPNEPVAAPLVTVRRARDRLEGRLLLEPVLRDGRARAEERHPPSRGVAQHPPERLHGRTANRDRTPVGPDGQDLSQLLGERGNGSPCHQPIAEHHGRVQRRSPEEPDSLHHAGGRRDGGVLRDPPGEVRGRLGQGIGAEETADAAPAP